MSQREEFLRAVRRVAQIQDRQRSLNGTALVVQREMDQLGKERNDLETVVGRTFPDTPDTSGRRRRAIVRVDDRTLLVDASDFVRVDTITEVNHETP